MKLNADGRFNYGASHIHQRISAGSSLQSYLSVRSIVLLRRYLAKKSRQIGRLLRRFFEFDLSFDLRRSTVVRTPTVRAGRSVLSKRQQWLTHPISRIYLMHGPRGDINCETIIAIERRFTRERPRCNVCVGFCFNFFTYLFAI